MISNSSAFGEIWKTDFWQKLCPPQICNNPFISVNFIILFFVIVCIISLIPGKTNGDKWIQVFQKCIQSFLTIKETPLQEENTSPFQSNIVCNKSKN